MLLGRVSCDANNNSKSQEKNQALFFKKIKFFVNCGIFDLFRPAKGGAASGRAIKFVVYYIG